MLQQHPELVQLQKKVLEAGHRLSKKPSFWNRASVVLAACCLDDELRTEILKDVYLPNGCLNTDHFRFFCYGECFDKLKVFMQTVKQ